MTGTLGPLVDVDHWHVRELGDLVRVELFSGGGFLVARLDVDREGAIGLCEDVREVVSQLDWRGAAWLRVNLKSSHILVNAPGWETSRTLCGRKPEPWRVDWRVSARPVLLGFRSDDCSICRGAAERQSRLRELAASVEVSA